MLACAMGYASHMTSNNDISDDARRQREYKARMRAKGFEQVPVWVPADAKPLIRDVAKKLREGAKAKKAQ